MNALLSRLFSGFTRSYYPDEGGGRRGFGCSPRVMLALLIMGGAIVYHYVNTTKYTNEFTGRVQRLALATPREEIAMGLQSAPTMIQQMGGESRDREAQATVARVGARIIQGTLVQRTPYEFRFHLLADRQTINAFALPGGQIFITEALFRLLTSEAQLAGVLGHEIGHVVARHSNEQMATTSLWSGLAQGAGVLLSDGQSNTGAQIAQYAASMRLMKFSRGDESEADKLGVQFLIEAGYDPEALIGVMEILADASKGNRQPEIMSTHPNPEGRAQEIRRLIEQYRKEGKLKKSAQ